MRNLAFHCKASRLFLLLVLGFALLLSLTACVQSRLPSVSETGSYSPDDAISSMYAMPTIQATMVAPHVTEEGLLQGQHEVYWFKERGHWLAPDAQGVVPKEELIQAYEPPGV